MILVVLGTQDKQFHRLLKIVDTAVQKKIINDEVIVQCGFTDFSSSSLKIFKYLSNAELNSYIKKADLIICHGGVGILTDALRNGKKVFAMARLEDYGEHLNNHQLQIVNKFADLGYIKKIDNYNDFVMQYSKLKSFKPKKPLFDNSRLLNIISDYIK